MVWFSRVQPAGGLQVAGAPDQVLGEEQLTAQDNILRTLRTPNALIGDKEYFSSNQDRGSLLGYWLQGQHISVQLTSIRGHVARRIHQALIL